MEKLTKQQQLIYEVLEKCKIHPTLLELNDLVHQEDSTIGQATVYRTINKLVKEGMVEKIDSFSNVVHYDVNHDHYHFICKKCGKIVDKMFSKKDKQNLDKMFILDNVTNYSIITHGLCKECIDEV